MSAGARRLAAAIGAVAAMSCLADARAQALKVADDGPLVVLAAGARVPVLANDTLDGRPVSRAAVDLRVVDDGGVAGAAFAEDGALEVPAGETHERHALRYEVCTRDAPRRCAQGTVRLRRFVVMDALLYADKPDMPALGVAPLRVVYQQELLRTNPDRLPPRDDVEQFARTLGAGPALICIDIESWPIYMQDDPTIRRSVKYYASLLRWLKEAAPHLRFGYYGVAPVRDYFRALKHERQTPAYSRWLRENELARPAVQDAAVIFADLYTFYDDEHATAAYMIENLKQARLSAAGRPVYAFLWPQFHEGGQYTDRRYMPARLWATVIDVARKHADGLVLWGGYDFEKDGQAPWDDGRPWWSRTREFLQALARGTPE